MSAGADRFFVDTNVLLYCLDSRDVAKQRAARRWCDVLWQRGSGRLSWQVLNEFYANATKRMQVPATVARETTEAYCEWQPSDLTRSLLRRAWHWVDRADASYWDALILASAENAGCRWLLSEDFQADRQYEAVRAINPFYRRPEEFFADL
jgi:predicted nucleic acid-binding protein